MAITTNETVAQGWVRGLTGDFASLGALSSPTMRIWHSHDNQWLTREEGSARMAASTNAGAPAAARFDDVRATVTETGFIIQASTTRPDRQGRTHILQVLTVEDGHVVSCEEYIAPETEPG